MEHFITLKFFSNWLSPMNTSKNHYPEFIEEHRKRIYFFICITLAIPVLIGYGLYFLINQNLMLDAYLNFTVATSFFIVAILIKKSDKELILYRLGMGSLSLLLIYNVGYGPYREAEVLWLLILPMAIFYLLGTREGIVWIAIIIFPSVLFIFLPLPFKAYLYPFTFSIAFCIAFILSVMLSYMLESLRAQFIFQIKKRNTELQKALEDIKKPLDFTASVVQFS